MHADDPTGAAHSPHGGRFPGCDIPADWTRIHHVIAWARMGPTDLDNGAPVCPHHHVITPTPGWSMHPHIDQTFSWTTPSGAVLCSQRHGRIVHTAATAPPRIDPDTLVQRARQHTHQRRELRDQELEQERERRRDRDTSLQRLRLDAAA